MSLRPYEQSNTSLHDLYQLYNPFAYPYEYTQKMWNRMNTMIDESMERSLTRLTSEPKLTFQDKGDMYHVSASLPGIDPKNVSVSYENGYLTVTGKQSSSSTSADGRVVSESIQLFQKTVNVPTRNKQKIKADLKHGMLTVSIPK